MNYSMKADSLAPQPTSGALTSPPTGGTRFSRVSKGVYGKITLSETGIWIETHGMES
jgi:hypothetical protein